jgi:hypothetical protein
LSRIGKPTFPAAAAASSTLSAMLAPGMIGRPHSSAARRDARLSPRRRIACGDGPMKVTPACAHASANAALWDRKP